MNDIDDDETDGFLDAGLSDLERRHDLQRKVAFGARVEVELTEDSTLRRYMDNRRVRAMEAISRLVATDARDAIAIAREQAIIAEFLTVRDWVRNTIDIANDADETIQREYRGESSDNDD